VLLCATARLWGRLPSRQGTVPGSFSIVVAAHNEANRIRRRLRELTNIVATADTHGEIIVVCDGCTDATARRARQFKAHGVRVIELRTWQGKAVALSRGCAAARGEILVFADVRQSWERSALPRLLDAFTDSTVGAVSGDLVLEKQHGVL